MVDRIPQYKEKSIFERIRLYLVNLRKNCTMCQGRGIFIKDGETFIDCPNCNDKYFRYKEYLLTGIPFDYVDLTPETIKQNYQPECFEKFMAIKNNLEDIQGKIIVLFKDNPDTWGVSTIGMMWAKQSIDRELKVAVAESADILYGFVDFTDEEEKNKEKKQAQNFYTSTQFLFIDNFEDKIITKSKGNAGFFLVRFTQLLSQRKYFGNTTVVGINMVKEQIKSDFPSDLFKYFEHNALWFRVNSVGDRMTETSKLQKDSKLKNCFETETIKKPSEGVIIRKIK